MCGIHGNTPKLCSTHGNTPKRFHTKLRCFMVVTPVLFVARGSRLAILYTFSNHLKNKDFSFSGLVNKAAPVWLIEGVENAVCLGWEAGITYGYDYPIVLTVRENKS